MQCLFHVHVTSRDPLKTEMLVRPAFTAVLISLLCCAQTKCHITILWLVMRQYLLRRLQCILQAISFKQQLHQDLRYLKLIFNLYGILACCSSFRWLLVVTFLPREKWEFYSPFEYKDRWSGRTWIIDILIINKSQEIDECGEVSFCINFNSQILVNKSV